MRRLAVIPGIILAVAWTSPLQAQGPGFMLGRMFTDPPGVSYRAGINHRLFGPVGVGAQALVVDSRYPIGNLWGLGADLALFRSGRPGVYFVGGVEGGFATTGRDSFWSAWSAGLGYELQLFGGLSLAAEGRYRNIAPRDYSGVEVGLRLGLYRGRQGGGGPGSGRTGTTVTSTTAPDAEEVRDELGRAGVPADRASLLSSVVQTALDVMGMPYRWGDEGEEGFDCSGLIQYAFGRHGVALPRRSADQAREGTPVAKALDALRAGDVLTFATTGRSVSHVGLYVGNGKFIHSASGGVQVSVLSPDDVSGRWWFRRWVGARRIVS